LHDRARQYEQTSFRGLFRFLRFIERLQAEQSDLGTARALGENENVVRIMSVHKSKGLEFPIVFVAGLGNQFNLRDLRRDLLIHKELGLGPQVVDFERRLRYPSLPRLVIEQQLLLESLSEEMRILYVALTRAREKLYLIGSQRDLPRTIGKWVETAASSRSPQGALPSDVLKQARCYLDWIGPCLVSHPDVKPLLTELGLEAPLLPMAHADPSRWQVELCDAAQLAATPSTEEQASELESVAQRRVLPDHGWTQAVTSRLEWTYPYAALQGKHIKVAVSELKRRYEAADEEAAPINRWSRPPVSRPAFMQQHSGLSPTEIGSAIHLLLQHLDLKRKPTSAYLEQLRDDMLANALLTPEEAQHIILDLVLGFLESELGCRLRRADQVWRELPFSLRLPAAELYGQEAAGEYVFVQGIVDCVWREGEQAMLLDFKSDNVNEHTLPRAIAGYQVQVDLYARAVTALFQLPVTERYLYFLRLDRAVQV